MNRTRAAACVVGAALALTGCFRYSFTGSRPLPGVETIQIDQFVNLAPLVNPNVANDLSEQVRNTFLRQSNLKLVSREGDVVVTGQIVRYEVTPRNITAGEVAALNEFRITVKVKYENTLFPDLGWTQEFTQFETFAQDQDFTAAENALLPTLIERVSLDIFNKILGDW